MSRRVNKQWERGDDNIRVNTPLTGVLLWVTIGSVVLLTIAVNSCMSPLVGFIVLCAGVIVVGVLLLNTDQPQPTTAVHTLRDGRQELQNTYDYWTQRVRAGDLLCDPLMHNQRHASELALSALNQLDAAGVDTGRADVHSSLSVGPEKVIIRTSAENLSDTIDITMDNSHRSYGDTVMRDHPSLYSTWSTDALIEFANKDIRRSWHDVDFTNTEYVVSQCPPSVDDVQWMRKLRVDENVIAQLPSA